jgi:rod shape-determining protein MreC
VFRNKKIIYGAVVAILLIVTFVVPPSFSSRGKHLVCDGVAPMERTASSLGQRISGAGMALRGFGGLAERNRDLSLELVRVQTKLSQLRDIEADNARLRRAFEFREATPHYMIPCNVISRNISGWWHSVRIGKGLTEGIRKNHAVISPDGLVGKTKEVSQHTSEVLLVCDPACKISAKIKRGNIFGLLHGAGTDLRGRPIARLDFIDKDLEIKKGDEVVTSGLTNDDGVSPKGVHIGYVIKAEKDASGLYQYAEVAPSATVSLLDYVFVVTRKNREVKP